MTKISGIDEGPLCTVARALEVLGDKWTLLIIRDAFNGKKRFSEFRESLGAAPALLASRLHMLCLQGILQEVPYRIEGSRPRLEYELTEMGHELKPVIESLRLWGDRYRPRGQQPVETALDDGRATTGFEDNTGPSRHDRDRSVDGPNGLLPPESNSLD